MHGGPVRVYSPEELSSMSAEEITAAIDRDIYEDAWARQAADRTLYSGRRKAEGLERGFYICPCCGEMRITSSGNTARCESCGTSVTVEESGRLNFSFAEGVQPRGKRFSAEWDEWQQRRLEGIIRKSYPEPEQQPIHCRFTVLTDEGRAGRPRNTELTLSIAGKRIELKSQTGCCSIDFEDITAMSMVKANRLLYTTADGYYELKCRQGCLRRVLNAWQAAVRLAEGEQK